jgi:hypothetical protein
MWLYNCKRLTRKVFPVALSIGCSLIDFPLTGPTKVWLSKYGRLPHQSLCIHAFYVPSSSLSIYNFISGTHTRHNIIQNTIRMHYLTFYSNIPYLSAGKASKLTIQVSPRSSDRNSNRQTRYRTNRPKTYKARG